MEDDRDILESIKRGNVEAFSLLVEKYHKSLLNFIYRMVGDESIVEDIGQEVFLDAYKSLRGFDEKRGTPFSAWLFISARNRCVSELRKRHGRVMVPVEEIPELAVGSESVEEELIDHEDRLVFKACIEKLSEPFKEPLLMSIQGRSFEEIAKGCGISIGTAKSRIHRARERLKSFVKDYFKEKGYERV